MPFTYLTYNLDSRDNNLCDKRVVYLKPRIKKNKPRKKMFSTILLELFLPFGPLKRQQTSDGLRFLAHWSYLNTGNKTKWRVTPKRKTGAPATHLLKQTAHCKALQSQTDWTSNHWTKNLKSLKNVVYCQLMPGSNNWKLISVTWKYNLLTEGHNRPFYRYGGHIELIRFKDYYRMPRGHEHISFVFSSAFRDIFSQSFLRIRL